MATSVLTLQPQPGTFPTSGTLHTEGIPYRGLFCAALTSVAVAIEGYHPYAEDGGLYAAGVERLLDPALFPHWNAFVLAPTRLSAFAPALAGLVRLTHLSLPVVLLLVHISSIFTTLIIADCIARQCWQSMHARLGAVAALACWIGLPVAGSSLQVMDPYVTARSFSTPCTLLGLLAVLHFTAEEPRQKGIWWLVICVASFVLGLAMHPLMAGYGVAAACILAFIRSGRHTARVAGVLSCGAAALLLAPALQYLAPAESHAYLDAALTRSYWFPGQWSWYELVGLIAPLASIALCASFHTPYRVNSDGLASPRLSAVRSLAAMAVVLGLISVLVAVLYARPEASTHLVARLQPLRAFHTIYLVMLLMLGGVIGENVLKRHLLRWVAALLLLGMPVFLAQRATFSSSPHIQLTGMNDANPWVQSFEWVRSHTPKNALFALEPDYIHAPGEDGQCFRAIAERSALPDYSKDGGEASIAPQLAELWRAGLVAQQGLNPHVALGRTSRNASELRALGVSWVIVRAGTPTDLACPYRNGAAKVCRLNSTGSL